MALERSAPRLVEAPPALSRKLHGYCHGLPPPTLIIEGTIEGTSTTLQAAAPERSLMTAAQPRRALDDTQTACVYCSLHADTLTVDAWKGVDVVDGTFGDLVRTQRTRMRRSLREVARGLGLTPSYISDIERGHRAAPAPPIVRRWAALIGADADALVEAALTDRKSVVLALDEEDRAGARNRAAVALARSWEELSDQDLQKIVALVEGRYEE